MGEIIDLNLIKSLENLKNKELITKKLVQSSFYLFVYELVKKSIIDNIKSFYGVTDIVLKMTINKEELLAEYKKDVLSLDKDYFLAHIKWLKKMGGIDDRDYKKLYDLRMKRNEVAHDIDEIVFYDNLRIDKDLLLESIRIFSKVEKWFVNNVVIPIHNAVEGDELEPSEDALSGPMVVLAFVIEAIKEYL